MNTTLLLSSSVLAAIVAAIVSMRINDKNICIQNITSERAKWREKIRELSKNLMISVNEKNIENLKTIKLELSTHLNPIDHKDIEIIETVERIIENEKNESFIKEFETRIALLLKHDWERAKNEIRPWFLRKRHIKRVPFIDCNTNNTEETPVTKNKKRSNNFYLSSYFFGLALSAGIIFFLVSVLKEPFESLVKMINKNSSDISTPAYLSFFALSAIVGSIWSVFYLCFKSCEKRFLEYWFSKEG